MPRQWGWVQLEQSDMRKALKMAEMAQRGFYPASIEEMKYSIQKPYAEVREEKKQGVDFPGCRIAKAAIERHPGMVR